MHPIPSRAEFTKRVARHLMLALFALALALGIGGVGYQYLGELGWLDALLNASMFLGRMGPVDPLHKSVAKLFCFLKDWWITTQNNPFQVIGR